MSECLSYIAFVHATLSGKEDGWVSKKRLESEFAAAPELLAALKLAAHALADYDEPAILRDIRAAIAKAEGK